MTEQRPAGISRVSWWVERALAALASFSYRRAPIALLVSLVITLGFFRLAQGLGLNTDITQLLPESFESVRDVRRLSDEFGGVGYVSVIAEGGNRDDLVRFAEDVAPSLAALPSVRYVDYKRPTGFFKDRGLYFLDKEDLETVRDRLEARRDWEVTKATGALLDDADTPPPVDFSDLESKYKGRLALDGEGSEKREADYYVSSDGTMLAMLVKPTKLASDFAFCKQVGAEVQGVIDGVDTSKYGPAFKVQLSGRYKKRVDLQEVLGHDVQVASITAGVLILLYISFHFRRVSAVALLFVPLLAALAATYGFAAVVIGELNILTSFIGAIMLGLAVDNGIHLLNRYYEERGAGKEPLVAIQKAFGEAARASSAAMLTNVGAFLCLLIAEFKAFREFGVLAAASMFFTLIAYVVIVPAMLGIGARFFNTKVVEDSPPFGYARPLVRWAPAVFFVMALGVAFAVGRFDDVHFNYDFSVMDEADVPSFHLDKKVNKLIGRSQTPLLVFANTPEEAEATAKELRERKLKHGAESTIDSIMTVSDLVPKQQAEKLPVIEEIGEIGEKLREDSMTEAQRKQRTTLLRMTEARPFTPQDLPEEVKRQFRKPGSGELANFVLIYPAVSMSDGRLAQRVADEVRGITLSDGSNLHASGESLVLADILTSMQKDLPVVFVMALLQQIILLWILMGGLGKGLLTIFPALVTMPLMIGLLPLFGLQLNYLNVILLPTLLGMGEDGGAHLVARVTGGDKLEDALGYTARGTLGAGLTAAFGFGAMVVASHPGLRSFGLVAVIGLGLNLIVCLLFLPALIALIDRHREWRASGRGGLSTLLSTLFYAGTTPRGGGTVGALLAIPVAWMLQFQPLVVRVGAALMVSAGAVILCNRYLLVRKSSSAPAGAGADRADDPQEIVLDEFAGALLAMVWVRPTAAAMALAFVLFRAFDIVKPWPVSFVEKRVKGGAGVVADDVVAGLMAGAVVFVLQAFFPAL